jgi:hypothetical protein
MSRSGELSARHRRETQGAASPGRRRARARLRSMILLTVLAGAGSVLAATPPPAAPAPGPTGQGSAPATSQATAAPTPEPDQTFIARSCLDAFNDGQRLRANGQLLAARRELSTCAADSCPELMNKPCAQWLAELRVLLPSIVVSATRADGSAVEAGRIEVDGVAARDRFGGDPIELDPGKHVVRAEIPGIAPRQAEFEIAPGTHSLPIRLRFEAPPRAPSAPQSAAAKAPAEEGPSHALAAVGWTGVAFGAAGLVVGAITGGVAVSNKSRLKDDCAAGACTQDDIDRGVIPAHVSTASFVVAGAGLAVGIICLVLDAGSDDAAGADRVARSELVLGPASLSWRARF